MGSAGGGKGSGGRRRRGGLIYEMIDADGLKCEDFEQFTGRETVLLALIFDDPSAPKGFRVSRHGHCVLGAREARARRSLLRLARESAKYLKQDLPDMFTPDSAQVFYSDGRLEEVRLSGRRVSGVDLEGNVEYGPANVGDPAFRIGPSGEVVLAPRDAGRRHLTLYRRDDLLTVSWDLRGNGEGEANPETSYATIIVENGAGPDPGGGEEAGSTPALRQAEEDLRGADAEELRRNLLPPEPVEVQEPRVIELGDPFRKLIYVCDEEEARSQLGRRYARSADFSDYNINRLARERSISFDTARAELFLTHVRARHEFVEKNLEAYFDRAAAVLRAAFNVWLVREVNTLTLADWKRPGVELSKTPAQVRKELRAAENIETGRRMGMPGPGRAPGTSPRMRPGKLRERREEKLGRIKAAMSEIVEEKLAGRVPDDKAVSLAEDAVTQKAVRSRLRISRSALRRWLREGGVHFDDLKGEVIKERLSRWRADSVTGGLSTGFGNKKARLRTGTK